MTQPRRELGLFLLGVGLCSAGLFLRPHTATDAGVPGDAVAMSGPQIWQPPARWAELHKESDDRLPLQGRLALAPEAATSRRPVPPRAPSVNALVDSGALLGSAGRLRHQAPLEESRAARPGESDRDFLLRMGRTMEAQGRLEEAQSFLDKAVTDFPGDPEALCRLAKVCLYLKDYDRAHELLNQCRTARAGFALADAVEGLYLFCLRDTRGALASIERALRADTDLREGYLIKADILFAIRDLEGAGQLLDDFLTRFPADPEGLYLSGIVCFYRKDLAKAQTLLEHSLKLNRRALNVRKDLVQVYSLTGRSERALALLDELLSERPGDKALSALRSGLRERLRLKRDGKVLVREPFRFLYPRDMKNAALVRIVDTFVAALGEVQKRRRTLPTQVSVTILNSTDQLLPAYYNHVSDEITISRQYYEGLDTQRKVELGRHLIFHEFSHLVLYQELKNVSLPPAALWLVEGLAEYEAGGYTYTHVDFDETFAEGFYDMESLEEYLPVSAMTKGQAREKAYIQSYVMAAFIMESAGDVAGIEKIKAMALGYTKYGPDHEKILAESLGVTPKEFLTRCTRYMRKRLSKPEAAALPE